VDAKGPLACFVDAAARAGVQDGWQFVVIGAVEEERNSEGARFLVAQYKPDFAIIGEPNRWDRIALGYKGSAWANVRIEREQAHTASGKITASEAAIDVWLQIKSYVDSFNADKRTAFEKLLLTLRGIESDSGDFGQWARLKLGIRLPVTLSPDDWYAEVEKALQGFIGQHTGGSAGADSLKVSMEPIGFPVPAWECEKNTHLVRVFLSAIRSEAGEPRFVYKTGTADLNIVAPVWKCPAVVYGPGDSRLDHTPDEHLDLSDFEKAVSVLTNGLMRLQA
jgi:LysW-gamma-L-lysine carboxypeptidase